MKVARNNTKVCITVLTFTNIQYKGKVTFITECNYICEIVYTYSILSISFDLTSYIDYLKPINSGYIWTSNSRYRSI